MSHVAKWTLKEVDANPVTEGEGRLTLDGETSRRLFINNNSQLSTLSPKRRILDKESGKH